MVETWNTKPISIGLDLLTKTREIWESDSKSALYLNRQLVAFVNKFQRPQSGIQDSNLQPHAPHACALASCANPRGYLSGVSYFILNHLNFLPKPACGIPIFKMLE